MIAGPFLVLFWANKKEQGKAKSKCILKFRLHHRLVNTLLLQVVADRVSEDKMKPERKVNMPFDPFA